MTVKDLRDYLNSLNLDEIQPDLAIVSMTDYEGRRIMQVDDSSKIILCEPSYPSFKPYLAIYTDEAIEECEKGDE